MTVDLSNATWRKARASSTGNGACVEVARVGDQVAIRDSKHPNPRGPVLITTADQFAAFVQWIKSR